MEKVNDVNSRDKITQLQFTLEMEQSKPFSQFGYINRLKRNLCVADKEEEVYWGQKSRDRWLLFGDKNS